MYFARQCSIQDINFELPPQHNYLMATSVVLNVQGKNEMDQGHDDTEQQGSSQLPDLKRIGLTFSTPATALRQQQSIGYLSRHMLLMS